MSTENPTTRERVIQAMQRDAELAAQLLALQEAVQRGKQAEDAVRKDASFTENVAGFTAERDRTIAQATAIRDAALAKAAAPLKIAQEHHQKALDAAQGAWGAVREEAIATHDGKRAEATRAREIEVAEARATVHRAEQEVAAHATTMDQHRRNIQERLGINLGKALE